MHGQILSLFIWNYVNYPLTIDCTLFEALSQQVSFITVWSQISQGTNFCDFHELYGSRKKLFMNIYINNHQLPRVMSCNLPTEFKYVDTEVL